MTELAVVGTPGGWSSEHLADSFSARTGARYLIDMSRVVLDMSAGSVLADTDTGVVDLCRLDGIFIKKIGHEYCPDMLDRLEILRYVEGRGVPMFSSPSRILRLLDRLACTVSLAWARVSPVISASWVMVMSSVFLPNPYVFRMTASTIRSSRLENGASRIAS